MEAPPFREGRVHWITFYLWVPFMTTKLVQLFHPKYRVDECLSEIKEVLESGWTGDGPKSAQFEKEFCEFLGVKQGIFLNSATAALHMAVRLLDLDAGSPVATTPITFCSTNHVILYEGLTPVFCDVDPKNLCLSFESVKKAIEQDGCKAVLWVHYGGYVSSDYFELIEYISDHAPWVNVIEDCAHAAGSFYLGGRRVGSMGNLSCFSFQAVKNLPSSDSGFLVVPSYMYDRAKKLAWLGIDKSTYARTSLQKGEELYKWRYSIDELGWKYNGNDVVAAICLTQLKYLDADNAYRKQIRRWYENFLGDVLIEHNDKSSTHLVVALLKNRDRIMAELKLRGYAPGVHYIPNYEFGVFSSFYSKGDCRITEKIAGDILTLPNHLRLTYEDVKGICQIITATVEGSEDDSSEEN